MIGLVLESIHNSCKNIGLSVSIEQKWKGALKETRFSRRNVEIQDGTLCFLCLGVQWGHMRCSSNW